MVELGITSPGFDRLVKWLAIVGIVLGVVNGVLCLWIDLSNHYGCGFPQCGNGTVLGDPCVVSVERVNLIPYCWGNGNATICVGEPLSVGKDFNVSYWVNGTNVTLVCTWSNVTRSYWWEAYVKGTKVAECAYGVDGCCYVFNHTLYQFFNKTVNG